MLTLHGVCAGYGGTTVLHHVSFQIQAGQIMAVLGHNGSGRSTLVNAIAGHVPIRLGSMMLAGHDVTHSPVFERARLGLAWVPEHKGVFTELTVQQNLLLGCGPGVSHCAQQQALNHMYARYPLLAQRCRAKAGTLSGGEKQLLALARAVMRLPKVLLLDEPVEGLAPHMVEQVRSHLTELAANGAAILLVEQKMRLHIAHQCMVWGQGEMVFSGTMAQLQMEKALWDA